mgnify:CR=1 FL=1
MAWLNHIGIATNKVERLKKLFSILELEQESEEIVQEQGVKAFFIAASNPPEKKSSLELLEPLDEQGTIAKYIDKKGCGVHHLSFEVKKGQLESLCKKLKDEGFRLIYDTPRDGAHNMKINFIHPVSTGGILVEVMESQ